MVKYHVPLNPGSGNIMIFLSNVDYTEEIKAYLSIKFEVINFKSYKKEMSFS